MLKTKYKLYNQYLKSSAKLLSGCQFISNDKIYCLLLNKLYENFKCIDNLITSKFYEQARIILRSNIEIALTYIYLVVFPNKKEEYIQQQDLLKFKNLFIILKDLKELPEEVVVPVSKDFQTDNQTLVKEYTYRMEKHFNDILLKENQDMLLKELKVEKFNLSEEIYKGLKKFFSHGQKPNFEEMYDKLKKENQLISCLNVRELFYPTYNKYSQLAHGIMSTDNPKDYKDILQTSYQINNIVLFFSKEKLAISIDPILSEMKINLENIEKLFKNKEDYLVF